MSNYAYFLHSFYWQLMGLFNLKNFTFIWGNVFYNFIVYFLFLQWLLLEDTGSSLFSTSLDFLLILLIRGWCWGCSTQIPSTTLTGFLCTFFSCYLNWCWWFTPVTFGELSLGTCNCFACGTVSSQWLLMWWYKSPSQDETDCLVQFVSGCSMK